MKNKNVRKITSCAILLAMAIAINVITGLIPGLNFEMPLGGRFFGFSLFPLLLIGFMLGPIYGILSGIAYGIFRFLSEGFGFSMFATNLSDAMLIFFLDYIIAFGAMGITGFFKNGLKNTYIFVFAGMLAQFIMFLSATIVGAILWVSYASYNEWTYQLFNSLGQSAWLYSAIYNGSYIITTMIVIAIISVLSRKQIAAISAAQFDMIASDN